MRGSIAIFVGVMGLWAVMTSGHEFETHRLFAITIGLFGAGVLGILIGCAAAAIDRGRL